LTLLSLFLAIVALAAIPVVPTWAHNEAAPPIVIPPTIKLGGHRNFEASQFAPVAAKGALPNFPFTADEFKEVAKDKISMHGGRAYIVTKTPVSNGYHNVNVPLDDYVKQLNEYESFLNQYGHTLRDGPLSRGRVNKTRPRRDMGVIFKLNDKQTMNLGPSDKLDLPADRRRVLPGEDVYKPHRADLVRTGNRNPVFSRGRTVLLSRDLLTGKQRYATVQDNGQSNGQPCGDEKPKDTEKGSRTIPCCEDGSNETGVADKDTDMESPGPCIDPKNSAAPSCLYAGSMDKLEWAPISITRGGSKGGWFGAELKMDQYTSNEVTNGVLKLDNKGTAGLDIMLFGFDFSILRASSQSWYDSSQTQGNGFGFTPAKIVIPVFGNLEIESDYSQSFEGPGATFFVGPVPITLSSGLSASIGLNKDTPTLQPPPLACNMPGTGQMDMILAAGSKVEVEFQAKINAIVASAGVDAQLDLVSSNFTSKVSTTINPSVNEVKITPSMNWSGTILKGHIDLFVEVDVIVYTKKWSVELFAFEGFTKSGSKPQAGKDLSKTIYAKKGQNISRSRGGKRIAIAVS